MISFRSLDSGHIERLDDALSKIKDANVFSLLFVHLAPFEQQLQQSRSYVRADADMSSLLQEAMVRCNVAVEAAMRDLILRNLVVVHYNYILTYTSTADEHLKQLEEVMARIRVAKLFLVAPLCNFLFKKVVIDGRLLEEGKPVQLDPGYVAPLKSFKQIDNVQDLHRLLGALQFIRRYVNNFETLVKPLVALRSHAVNTGNFQWDQEHQKALQSITDALPTAEESK
eukprot:TRINITY_DN6951_c0_g1_i1.p1 TRINITY_DN6951_c0_g1~~TRINITY_DN6951_c0_g1_i1.p1  ORF type:complete len:227 (+),score=52.86 TRINITY_DN6951_c0_g1_i1:175-855(+)